MSMYININLSGYKNGINNQTNTMGKKKEGNASLGQQLLDCIYCGGTVKSEGEKERYAARIYAKIRSGQKLTSEELNFLARTDPVMYSKALRAQLMRKSLEERLHACRSKQEAESVYQTAVSGVSEKDPDREIIVAALADAYKEFRESDEYKRLPEKTEEEDKQRSQGRVRYSFNTNGYQESYKTDGTKVSFSAKR
ncbi:MAG: hypothetical protein GX235_10955 [Clostridiales bacterium]|nr:hypothetical protein [Clostridiales bacterium]